MSSAQSGRNAGARSGDDTGEMTLFDRADDDAIAAALSGRVPPGRDDLTAVAQFTAALENVVVGSPRPSDALATLLAEGLSPEETGVTARSRYRPSTRRTRPVLETALAKLASLGLAAKLSVAGTAVLAASTGAGVVGVLPDAIQRTAADIVATVSPFEIPRPDGAAGVPEDVGAALDGVPPVEAPVPDNGDPANDHGRTVSDTAVTSDAEGCERGHEIATVAGGDPVTCIDADGADRAGAAPDRAGDAAAERAGDAGTQRPAAAGAGQATRDAAAQAAASTQLATAEAGRSRRDAAAAPGEADPDASSDATVSAGPVDRASADAGRHDDQPDEAADRGSSAAAEGAGNAEVSRP